MCNEEREHARKLMLVIGRMSDNKFDTYCLGTGCMTKCETCQHEKNWQLLNELDDDLRLNMQAKRVRVNETVCQLTSGIHYKEDA